MNIKTIMSIVGAVVSIGGVVILAVSNIKNLNKIKKLQDEKTQLICKNATYEMERVANVVKNNNE